MELKKKISQKASYYRRYLKRIFSKVLLAKVPPHNIAMGFAVGIFIGLSPILVFQIIPVLAICMKMRYSKLAGFISVFITNPFTFIPIYLFNLSVGAFLLGSWIDVDIGSFQKAIYNVSISSFLNLGQDTIIAFVAGSLLVATLASLVTYWVMRFFIISWRKNREELLKKLAVQQLRHPYALLNKKILTKAKKNRAFSKNSARKS